jgi:hypothetical protein
MWGGLWFRTPLSTIFKLYHGNRFIGGRNLEKNTDLPQVTEKKRYHIMLYRIHPAWAGFELTTFVMTGTYCIGSFKSNYRIITTTMALNDLNDMYNIKDLMLLIMIMIWFSNPNLFNDFQLNHFKTETWMERIEIHVFHQSVSVNQLYLVCTFFVFIFISYPINSNIWIILRLFS